MNTSLALSSAAHFFFIRSPSGFLVSGPKGVIPCPCPKFFCLPLKKLNGLFNFWPSLAIIPRDWNFLSVVFFSAGGSSSDGLGFGDLMPKGLAGGFGAKGLATGDFGAKGLATRDFGANGLAPFPGSSCEGLGLGLLVLGAKGLVGFFPGPS